MWGWGDFQLKTCHVITGKEAEANAKNGGIVRHQLSTLDNNTTCLSFVHP